ncbi:hypothetical protein F2Q68_00017075 [Brassica cretica]|uniref:Uncharacterized protein n=2 Tax=Brassica cretica TaxID=69181 RepID=A0A8S9HQD8_BRACR|nr:hypothetical protein F2Q68_00017075 [Brassica cretica]KAF3605182.1 hypothetical protein DY000_02049659 [Brassica cretica]
MKESRRYGAAEMLSQSGSEDCGGAVVDWLLETMAIPGDRWFLETVAIHALLNCKEGRSCQREGTDLMISGNGSVSAVTYLSDLKLFEVVFVFPSSSELAPSEDCGSLCKAYLEAMWSLIQTPELAKFNIHDYHNNEIHILQVINIHRTTERFLSLIHSLELKSGAQLDNLDWATDIVEHWKSISLMIHIPETSKIRVLTCTPL